VTVPFRNLSEVCSFVQDTEVRQHTKYDTRKAMKSSWVISLINDPNLCATMYTQTATRSYKFSLLRSHTLSELMDGCNSKLYDFKKWDVGARTGLIWLRTGTGGRHL